MADLSDRDRETVRRFATWKHRPKERGDALTESRWPQTIYAELMKSAFAPALRAEGLKGSAGRFELPSDVYWAQLGFQKSAFSDGREVRYTINLSVIRRADWEAQAAAKPHLGMHPTPTLHYGSWANQIRIGSLTPSGEDKWWRIVRDVPADPVRDDTVADLVGLAVPWLRSQTST
jgi:Domain of unknown function (DUF4304)